ncbi:hypothetical protein PRIPAC_94935 [Pristionchus pacificus]|uniref:Uncharacterized protein n=1 Tax=Pristionchus pacificus TaxID=54126 RepID=A0A2A6CIG0_PRIPA|nr:hypothetical protein PRIPAC_94935 [Pristionchus pacificus]|eukprot:PDM77801.1 hypothetical protein PRIPAC_34668 [Pristionchus pacificus]
MVQTVKKRMKRFPEVVDGVFHSIDAISREAATILSKTIGGSDHEGTALSSSSFMPRPLHDEDEEERLPLGGY